MTIKLKIDTLQFPNPLVADADPRAFEGTERLAWTPAPTGLTVVNGTGGATYTGFCVRVGRLVFWRLKISVTGTCTTASAGGGATYFDGLPFTPVEVTPNVATDSALGTYNTAQVSATGRCYMPAWTARNVNIYLSGSFDI